MLRSSATSLGSSFIDLGRQHERRVLGQGTQARGLGQQRKILHAVFPQRRNKARFVDPEQRLARLDRLAFAHQDFRDDAAVDRLDHLQLARGDDLADAARHLIHRREGRPQHQHQQNDADRAQQIRARNGSCSSRAQSASAVQPSDSSGRGGIQRANRRSSSGRACLDQPAEPSGKAGNGAEQAGLHAAFPMRPWRRASTTCALGPSATILPASITMMRSTRSSSEVRCVTTIRSCRRQRCAAAA